MALKKHKRFYHAWLADIGKNPHQLLLRGVLLAGVFFSVAIHLHDAFLAQLASNKGGQLSDFSQSLTDPDALASLARKEHLGNGNLNRALTLYQRGLSYFVLHVPSWLGVAEIFNDQEQRGKAVAALRAVHSFAANGEETTWTKALLAHELDQEEILTSSLSWLAEHQPDKIPQILALADLRWQDASTFLRLFNPDHYPAVLDRYLRLNDRYKAAAVWQALEEKKQVSNKALLSYVDFLLHRGEVSEAAAVWRRHLQHDSQLLHDGSFREPLTGSGFGWRLAPAKGMTWQQNGGAEGLTVTFAGTDNPAFRLSQLVALAPGHYLFKGQIQSHGLTTDQRPSWTVSGYQCEGLTIHDTMLPPTMEWREFVLPFTVPESCQAIQLLLQRNPSHFFDNKLAGTIALKGLAIEPLPSASEKSVPPAAATAPPAPGKGGRADIKIRAMKVR